MIVVVTVLINGKTKFDYTKAPFERKGYVRKVGNFQRSGLSDDSLNGWLKKKKKNRLKGMQASYLNIASNFVYSNVFALEPESQLCSAG